MKGAVKSLKWQIQERIRWRMALFHLFRYLAVPFLIILPKSWILSRLRSFMSSRIYVAQADDIMLYKSGRAAICALMTSLKQQDRQIVFVPDYICNVVPKACEDAGFVVKEYPTDEFFVPMWDQLDQQLYEDEKTVLLICSLMGTSPVLASQLQQIEQSHPDLFVIADECQNLVENSPVTSKPNRAIVFSFNDKTCPGIMGGGVVCPPESSLSLEYHKMSFRRAVKCFIFFTGSMAKRIIRDVRHIVKLALRRQLSYTVSLGYEYSMCQSAHYDTQPESINRISAAYAWLNLKGFRQYAQVRQENCRVLSLAAGSDLPTLQEGFSFLTAPAFVPLSKECDVSKKYPVPVKAPYAKHNNSNVCQRKQYSLKVNIPYVAYASGKRCQ
ncbi:MAG: hypothetical protein DRP56_06600 [Planctomycetota bacterium]|nr:MAG: hypothetical protein DRP56_06600 [Planctomycetota bacterium]